ncbi:hypothetical protein PNOK_0430100 [Pyrrhoderma noxium]|uniref:NmrA-like domain-containing protein n=1 Tax=Pyrrhoderma noxium TaxID=2282107 RepID=A0A286UIG2_9AGAM|nr:hypothetical protein PNOK_0430100 [Pyrrhoderma noxium]
MALPESSVSVSARTILVIGATGKQGHAFIGATLSTGAASNLRILALTRSIESARSRSLDDVERVKLVEGDLDDPKSIRDIFEAEKVDGKNGIWGVFMVLAFPGLGADASGEERQGKLIADISHEYKVEHLVFSSVERGGEDYDDQLTLDRLAKVQVERHIKSIEDLRWTILRPVFFMDNFDGAIGKITSAVLKAGLKKDTKIQFIAADDIGQIALAVFLSSEDYAKEVIVVIGDALTTTELTEAYTRGSGHALPSVPSAVARILLSMNKHTKDLISDMERVSLARANASESNEDLIARCLSLYPGMKNVEGWARARGSRKDRQKGWNNVTIGDLVKGKR